MEYQKIINLFGNTTNQPTIFITKNGIEINDDSHGMYRTNNQIKFKTSMLKPSSCNYSYTYIILKGAISIAVQARDNPDNANEKVVFKNFVPFTDSISQINNSQIDNAKYINVIMSKYDLIEFKSNYSKTSRSLWQQYRDEPALTNAGAIANFHAADNKASCKFKQEITGVADDDGSKNVETMVPLSNI